VNEIHQNPSTRLQIQQQLFQPIQILYKHEQVASICIIKLRPSINAPARASAQIIIKQIDRTLKAAPAGD
jgi:hypothetical protein